MIYILQYLFIFIFLLAVSSAELVPSPNTYVLHEGISENTIIVENIENDSDEESEEEFFDESKYKMPFRITSYKPIYFIEGMPNHYGLANSKVNVSFKYQLIEDLDLFFGYSQIMFWDRNNESSPFRDINYNPELFYKWHTDYDYISAIDFGREHLSNGRDGADSRSIDNHYLQLHTSKKKFYIFNTLGIVSGQIKWFNLWQSHLKDNPDIGKYIGNWRARFNFEGYYDNEFFKSTEFYIEFFAGGNRNIDLDLGGQEIGLVFSFEFLGANPRAYLQFYNGYAESLLEYYQLEHAFRLGVIII
ncbi:phospholipase A [bacterium]|nr:phospholipase A [bacterium]